MTAKTEAEVLEHMAAQFRAGGGLIGPASTSSWSDQKADALMAAEEELGEQLECVLDVGVGDLTPVQRWVDARGGVWPWYYGWDGCPAVLEAARERYPDLAFFQGTFEQLVRPRPGELHDADRFSAVLLLDVLYHMPSDELCRQLFDYAFRVAAQAVVLSYALDVQDFGGRRVGEAGFAWFPRPEVAEWVEAKVAEGWRVVYESDDFRAGPQKQRLVALVRG